MQRQTYSAEQRAHALELLATVGLAEAVRITGIAKGTISSWGHRAGVEGATGSSATAAGVAVAAERKLATIAERKAALAEGLMSDIERLRRDLFAPTVERKAIAAGHMREVEIVEIRHATTTPAERKTTVQAIAGALEAVQLLTGEATQRIEQVTGDTPRARANAVVDELERRRQAKAS